MSNTNNQQDMHTTSSQDNQQVQPKAAVSSQPQEISYEQMLLQILQEAQKIQRTQAPAGPIELALDENGNPRTWEWENEYRNGDATVKRTTHVVLIRQPWQSKVKDQEVPVGTTTRWHYQLHKYNGDLRTPEEEVKFLNDNGFNLVRKRQLFVIFEPQDLLYIASVEPERQKSELDRLTNLFAERQVVKVNGNVYLDDMDRPLYSRVVVSKSNKNLNLHINDSNRYPIPASIAPLVEQAILAKHQKQS